MKEFNSVKVDADGFIKIPIIVDGRELYEYYIVPEEIEEDTQNQWLDHLSSKIWFNAQIQRDFTEAFNYALNIKKSVV